MRLLLFNRTAFDRLSTGSWANGNIIKLVSGIIVFNKIVNVCAIT